MSPWRSVMIGAAGLLVAGCSLLVSTDGLTGSVANGADGGDAGTGTTGDSGGPTDEAGADAEGGPPKPYCASLSPQPKFCADFDTGGIPELGSADGTLTLETTQFLSAPRLLLGVVEGNATSRGAAIGRSFPGTPTSLDVSYDVYVEEYDADHGVELTTVLLTAASGIACSPSLAIRNGTWAFSEYCQPQNGPPVVDHDNPTGVIYTPRKWTRVGFALDFTTRTFSATISGQKVLDARPFAPAYTSGSIKLYLGIYYLQAGAGRSKIYFDNVRFDYQ